MWYNVFRVKLGKANGAPGIYFKTLSLRLARCGRSGHGDEEPMENRLHDRSHPRHGSPVPTYQVVKECPSVVPHLMEEGALIPSETTAGD